MKIRGKHVIAIGIAAASPLSCTWVHLTEEGRAVRVLRAEETPGCERLGAVKTNTTDRVIIFARSDRKIREELEALARNEAGEMGGDAIAASGSASGGRQSFDVYRCAPR